MISPRPWNDLAFADGKCEALAAAADGIPANVLDFAEQQRQFALRELVEQQAAMNLRISRLLGPRSAEIRVAQALRLILAEGVKNTTAS